MKLPVSNTNAPIWRDITVKAELPAQLKPLDELAKTFGGYGTARQRTSSAHSTPTYGAKPAKTL